MEQVSFCEVCGKPATQWMLRDPFGKSDAKRPLCGEHGLRLRDPTDVAEIERLTNANEFQKKLLAAYPKEVERLQGVIKHMCDELCSPGDCQMPDCPRASPVSAGADDAKG